MAAAFQSSHPFEQYAPQVRHLRLNDRHFSRLFDELLDLNEKISAIEHGQPTQPPTLIDLKIRRLYLTEELHDKLLKATD